MSNERIDRILKENNLEFISFAYPNMYPRIRKAIGQYGKERYERGQIDGIKLGWEQKEPVIDRLRSLVQAQKELIDWYELKIELYPLQQKETDPLFNRIKQLEQ